MKNNDVFLHIAEIILIFAYILFFLPAYLHVCLDNAIGYNWKDNERKLVKLIGCSIFAIWCMMFLFLCFSLYWKWLIVMYLIFYVESIAIMIIDCIPYKLF